VKAGNEEASDDAAGHWETRHGIHFPAPPSDAPRLSVEEVRDVIDGIRAERAEQVMRAGS